MTRRFIHRLGGLLAAGLVSLLMTAPEAAGQCSFSGLSTTGFGKGTGVCSTSTLLAELDTGPCTLRFSFEQDPFWCGNTYLTQHLLIVGVTDIPGGAPIGGPFLPGSRLYVAPLVIAGPFPGASSEFVLPADPSLSGLPFYVQAAPTFITTTSFPIEPETGLSTAVELVLQ